MFKRAIQLQRTKISLTFQEQEMFSSEEIKLIHLKHSVIGKAPIHPERDSCYFCLYQHLLDDVKHLSVTRKQKQQNIHQICRTKP